MMKNNSIKKLTPPDKLLDETMDTGAEIRGHARGLIPVKKLSF
jgi:hypothetical protein